MSRKAGKVIFSKWMADALVERGFRLINKKVNRNHPSSYCYAFEVSDELYAAITELSGSRKKF